MRLVRNVPGARNRPRREAPRGARDLDPDPERGEAAPV